MVTASFNIKGNLRDGERLTAAIYLKLTELAETMAPLAETMETERLRGQRESLAHREAEKLHRPIYLEYIEYEKLYKEITGELPKFPEV